MNAENDGKCNGSSRIFRRKCRTQVSNEYRDSEGEKETAKQ